MDKNLKTCLIIGAALVFVAGLVMVGAFTLIYLNRDKISDELEQWTDQMEATGDDGRAFGETADQQGCVDEGLRRIEGKNSIQSISSIGFVAACLQTAAESEGFCEGVPEATSIFDSALWPQQRCAEMETGNEQGCQSIMQVAMAHCQETAAE